MNFEDRVRLREARRVMLINLLNFIQDKVVDGRRNVHASGDIMKYLSLYDR